MKEKENKFLPNFFGIVLTIILAILFRIIFFEPYHIPSGSMKPNLLVGDYVLVNKMAYGYSKYSVPFHPNFLNFHLFQRLPERGEVAVFVPQKHQDMYYVKRIVGLPGDKVEIKDGNIYVNDKLFTVKLGESFFETKSGLNVRKLVEDNGIKKYDIIYVDNKSSLRNSVYYIPNDSLFAMGDNRDNSLDSRFQNEVGFIPVANLVGRVAIVALSINEKDGNNNLDEGKGFLNKISNIIRFNRFFHSVN